MSGKIKTSYLQTILETACKGTTITPRELLKELTIDDLTNIRNGDMVIDNIVSLVLELVDNKDNAELYRVNVKNAEPYSSSEKKLKF